MQSAVLRINGELKQSWFNFTYKPLHDAEGKVYGILHMAVDVSKQVQLQEQKDEFLGIASHELKTPVTSIKAYAQVLHQMMKDTNHTQETHMLYRMDKQINKLTNLVENLLDVTKIQAGKLEFDEVKFDFNALVKEVVTDMQAIITSHNIQLQPDETANVFADKERIEQVLTNLILNAAKYSPQANVILVRTKKENDSIFCFIEDKGIGIPEENLDNIFDRFYQVSRNNPTRFSGLGLGLYISAEIIRRSNGSINVVSKEGEGSTFSFSLKTVS
jgi:signal transduction histidine kinase